MSLSSQDCTIKKFSAARITLLGNSYYAMLDGPIADYRSVGVQHHLPRLGIRWVGSTDI